MVLNPRNNVCQPYVVAPIVDMGVKVSFKFSIANLNSNSESEFSARLFFPPLDISVQVL